MHDLIIIGAGLAGLGAGYHAGRSRLKTLIISRTIGGRLLEMPLIEGIPAISPISGQDLARRLHEQNSFLGTEFVESDALELRKGLTLYTVKDGKGVVHKAKTLLIASGAGVASLNVLGEDEFLGKGITRNPVTDREMLGGKHVAVYGSGEGAALIALWLANACPQVHLISHHPSTALPHTKELLSRTMRITQHTGVSIKYVSGTLNLERITLSNNTTLNVSGLVLAQSGSPSLGYLATLGPALHNARLKTDANGKTNLSGVYALGDVASSGLTPTQTLTQCEAAINAIRLNLR